MRLRLPHLIATALVVPAFLAACAGPATAPAPAAAGDTSVSAVSVDSMLATHNLSGKTPEQVVEALDQDPRQRPLPLKASVHADKVVLTDSSGEATMRLEGGKHYLSIAPYKTQTHECYFHNLGTCKGEMSDAKVHVTIVDKDGKQLVDADAVTYPNGFVGFWVPKNTSGTIKISADGMTGETPFSSAIDGATCVTTLKLT